MNMNEPTPQQASNQERILHQIKRLGPQTVKLLSEHLAMTTMGIRQHLAQLEAEGLVKAGEPVPQQRGRPVASWTLTAAGHERFPDAHAQVTVELIASIRDQLGEASLEKVIGDRARQTLAGYREALSTHQTLAAKLEALAAARTAEGYMAEVTTLSKDEFLLAENHCPICEAAKSCQGFCSSELESFQSLFEGLAEVTREEYLLAGGRRCTYRITRCR